MSFGVADVVFCTDPGFLPPLERTGPGGRRRAADAGFLSGWRC
jgi:hypothetical protein